VSSDIFLLASSPGNDDFMQYIDFGSDNNSSPGGSPSGEGGPSDGGNETKKDTDRLYDYLKPYEGQKLSQSKSIDLRARTYPSAGTPVQKEKADMSRIFAHIRKENPSFFSSSEYENPGQMRLKIDFLNKIKGLHQNYPND
jgi:hypothetical protein